MQTIRWTEAWHGAFPLGGDPVAVSCKLSIVEANGQRYLKTPFAFVNAHGDDDPDRQIGKGYYATEADCQAYLAAEYPWAEESRPLMDALMRARHYYGDIVGTGKIADKANVSTDALYKLARGHKSFSRKAVRAAAKAVSGGSW